MVTAWILTIVLVPKGGIPFKDILYDRMTERFSTNEPDLHQMFAVGKPFPLEVIDLSNDAPLEVLKVYNKKRGLALDLPEMEYLVEAYKKVGRVSHTASLIFLYWIICLSYFLHHQSYYCVVTVNSMMVLKTILPLPRYLAIVLRPVP